MGLGVFERSWIVVDYRHVLPWLARLPRAWGRRLAAARGWLYALIERDWRQFSFADGTLAQRTRLAHIEIAGAAVPARHLRGLFRRRYVMQSMEELEAAWLMAGHLEQVPVRYEGLEAVQLALKEKGQVVFLIGHLASNVLGTVFLNVFKLPVMGMSSNVVDDPRVHPAIGAYFRRKYQLMGEWLNGGGVIDRQGNTRRFVKFLQKPGIVVVVGDLPPEPGETVLYREFFGKRRGFASGAARLADLSGAALMSFCCQYINGGFVVRFSNRDEHPLDFIEKQIRNDPGAWWAADLLPIYPLSNKSQD